MYNGIGLTTARGSGTNGYVQTNKFFLKARVGRVAAGSSKGFDADQGIAGVTRKPNKEILEHDRKRQIELKLVVLEDKLLDQGFTEAEVAERLAETRLTLEASAADETGALVGDKKVSDTQTHQIAARKERQMETLRAAFGIRSSEPEEPNIDEEPTKNPRNDANKHRKSEHSFLDRGYGGKRSAEEENQKSENEDKMKSAKESERNKKQKSKKRMNRDDSSDTDIEKKRKVSKRHRKSKRNVSDDSESDSSSNSDSDSDSSTSSYDSSDSDRSSRRKKAVKKNHRRTRGRIDEEDKKHKASQSHRKGRNKDSDSSSDDEARKKVEKRKSSIRRHDSDNSSSDEEGMLKEKPHKRTDSPKKNAEKPKSSNRRHDSDDSSSDEEGLSKEKQRKRIGGRYDSEDDSETDVEAKKNIRLEENRKQNYIKPKSRTTKSVQRKPDSEDESDRGRNNKIRRKPDIDSESEGEKSRKPESRTFERSRRIGEDEKIEKHREKRHDSDDEEPAKKTAPVKRGLVSSDGDDYPVKNNQTNLEYKRAEKNYPVGRDDMNRRDRRKSPPEDFRPRSVVSNERKKEARDSDDDRDLRSGRYGQVDRRDVSHRNRSDWDQEQRGDDRWQMSYEDERRERKHGRDEDEARGYRSHGRDSGQNRERDYAKRPKYDDSRASERNRR